MVYTYIIDTSSLIELTEKYTKKVFGKIWTNMHNLVSQGRLVSHREVYKEVERGGDDNLIEFCKKNVSMFLDNNDEILEFNKEIVRTHINLVDHRKASADADPFIIAVGRHLTASPIESNEPVIVTEENTTRLHNIPHVCRDYGIKTMKLVELFEEENWTS